MKDIFCFSLLCIMGCLAACGSESLKYNCTCAATCDGNATSTADSFCSEESQAQESIDKIVATCKSTLENGCQVSSCECTCLKSGESC